MVKSKVTPNQFLMFLFISRLIVSLTNIPALRYQKVKGDLLVSILIMIPLSIIMYLPIYFYIKKFGNTSIIEVLSNKSIGVSKVIGIAYAIWMMFLAATNILRFVNFVTSELTAKTMPLLFVVLITFASAYAAYLGVQGLSRASLIVLLLLFVCFTSIILFNIKDFSIYNFSPIISESIGYSTVNSFHVATNTSEIVALLFLLPHVNGDVKNKAFKFFISISATLFVLYFVVIGVLGDFAKVQNYPLFALSQISGFGILERLDSFHTSSWIIAIVLKIALYITVADVALRDTVKIKRPLLILSIGLVIIVLCALMLKSFAVNMLNANFAYIDIPFIIFTIIIPIITLFFKKKGGEQLDG